MVLINVEIHEAQTSVMNDDYYAVGERCSLGELMGITDSCICVRRH